MPSPARAFHHSGRASSKRPVVTAYREGLPDAGDAVGAQEVEGEGADMPEDAGPAADAAVILPERAVADVVTTVPDPPMAADRQRWRSVRPAVELQVAVQALGPVIKADATFENCHCRCAACHDWDAKT